MLAVYMTLIWQSGDTAHLGMSVLFWVSSGMLLWEKRDVLTYSSSLAAKGIGLALMGMMLWQVSSLLNSPALTDQAIDPALRLFPFVAMLGVGLVMSGFKGLWQYRSELTILFFLGGPSIIAMGLPDLSPITARFATFLLWYTGFNVSVQGVYIHLPTGSIEVYAGCSGIESMTYLLGLSVIALLMFPVRRSLQMAVPLMALLIGFGVNGVRVALMAVLASLHNKASFDYWHTGDGSLIFGVIAVGLFWLMFSLLRRGKSQTQRISEE